jgi:hypothetical protein
MHMHYAVHVLALLGKLAKFEKSPWIGRAVIDAYGVDYLGLVPSRDRLGNSISTRRSFVLETGGAQTVVCVCTWESQVQTEALPGRRRMKHSRAWLNQYCDIPTYVLYKTSQGRVSTARAAHCSHVVATLDDNGICRRAPLQDALQYTLANALPAYVDILGY